MSTDYGDVHVMYAKNRFSHDDTFDFRRGQFSMGPQEDYIETVFTCEGDFDDPHLQDRLDDFQSSLKDLLLTGKLLTVFMH